LSEVEQALANFSANDLLAGSMEPPPSLRFALEGIAAQASPGKNHVRSNALLLWENLEDARKKIQVFQEFGYRCCKLKISAENWQERISLLEEFPIRFRLDANRSLDPRALDQMIKWLSERNLLSRVDYLEEPFPGIWQDSAFHECPLSLAADESAASLELATQALRAKNPPSVFVLKPTVMGGLASLAPFLRLLASLQKRFVFTSALEAEPGRRSLLAFLSQGQFDTCGLSTGALFQENFLLDCAEWREMPSANAAELRWLGSLSWTQCP
jgi:hypothetical protein